MTEHDGDPALAAHLGKLGDNETITIRTHGLSADTIDDAIAELRLMGLGRSTRKPLIHAWASPSVVYAETDWEHHRTAFEREFGLEGFPCLEVFHHKLGQGGRTVRHGHRVYLRIDADGNAVRTSHSAIRQEKVSRIAEFEAGERLTSGCFNQSVVARLRRDGRYDVADAMQRAGLGDANAVSASTSSERAEAERRNDVAPDEVWRRASAAWRRSDDGASLLAALAESGLRLALGEKCPVVVTPAGAIVPLLRAINKGGERQSGHAVRKAELAARLHGLVLPAAGELGPMPGFGPGLFAIINLDRLPLPDQPQAPDDAEFDKASPPPVEQPRLLTIEQHAALLALDNAFHNTAAARAKAVREAIEAEILETIARRQRAEPLRQRVSKETAAWDLPSIGVVGWRDAYRAELAGLPKRYGEYLRWVDRLDAERRRVVLKSGATVTLAPTQARSNQATTDVIAIMIAHARGRGWQRVTITGGTAPWRQAMTKAATRAGFAVADAELQGIAQAERVLMAREQLLQRWWRIRAALATTAVEQQSVPRKVALALLARLADDPGIVELVADPVRREHLVVELEAYRDYRKLLQQHRNGSGPPRPG
ncbi:LPD7 domain-containing protein [Devosia sp.]|uniref:LPD7 domain-containing protein n=1 Tax=Devosia sp. TaxID=1871048 RepID=UPI002EE01099